MKATILNSRIIGVSCVIPKKALCLYDEQELYGRNLILLINDYS